jgi:hypothetical protein
MKKAKAKAKTAEKAQTEGKIQGTRRTAAKKSGAKKSRRRHKDANPAEMRRDITNIVGSEMTEITMAVVGEAKKGQLATVKYLFEVVGVYPPAEGNIDRPEDDTLARRLVRTLGLPEGPLPGGDDNDPLIKVVISPAVPEVGGGAVVGSVVVAV